MATNPELLEHEYDGIREYDNPTPGWWHALFFCTVAFSLFYVAYFHGNPGAPEVHRSWKARQVAEFRRIFGEVGDLAGDEATIFRMMDDSKMLAVAESVYVGNCAACHGSNGAGTGGSTCPNLTDDQWKNVKTPIDIYNVITKGAGAGAMPAWENRLSQNERVIIAAFVAKMRENPIGGRAPEGESVPPWTRP